MTRHDILAALLALFSFSSISMANEDRRCNETTGICDPVPFVSECTQDSYYIQVNNEQVEVLTCEL